MSSIDLRVENRMARSVSPIQFPQVGSITISGSLPLSSDESTAVAGGSFVVEHTDDKHRAQVVHLPHLLVVIQGGLPSHLYVSVSA